MQLARMTAREIIRVLLIGTTTVVFFAAFSANAMAGFWDDENALVNEPHGANRDTYVYTGTPGARMARSLFVDPVFRAYYNSFGFDNNFLTWADTKTIDPDPSNFWTRCALRGAPGLCPSGNVGANTVGHALTDPTVVALEWGGQWISTACGNWRTSNDSEFHVSAHGPIPTIRGAKYEDLNANGSREPGEPGVAGWMIRLSYGSTEVASTTTDANGNYSFSLNANTMPIGAGTYSVTEDLQSPWIQSQAPSAVTFNLGDEDRVVSGMDFGNWRPAKINGVKWHDTDVDGIHDSGEPPLPDWAFELDGGAASKTSDANGDFTFGGLRPGEHSVSETLKPHWRSTSPLSGSISGILLQSNQTADIEFGNICLGNVDAELKNADSAANVPGVSIKISEINVPGILDNDPALPLTTTSPSDFSDLLPGTYEVEFTLPDDYSTVDPDAVVRNGKWVIVKTVTVSPCQTTTISAEVYRASKGKVTGGTRFKISGGYVTNGFNFKSRGDGSAQGSIEHVDHRDGLNLHSNVIDTVLVSGNKAWVWGRVTVGGATYRFRLILVDNGEPGLDDDYWLTVDSGYEVSNGSLSINGNVQIHPAKP
ncbi:MAG: SdrD B-like domain-containing protein [Solirubrobacterales bacterium]